MKTILESAQEYATEHFKEKLPLDAEKSFIDGFLAGANFAQEWISVKDELPEHGKTVLIMCNNKYIGLGCIRYGKWDYKLNKNNYEYKIRNIDRLLQKFYY